MKSIIRNISEERMVIYSSFCRQMQKVPVGADFFNRVSNLIFNAIERLSKDQELR